jgi:hypothetical protein
MGLRPYAQNAGTGDQVAMSGSMKFKPDLLSLDVEEVREFGSFA